MTIDQIINEVLRLDSTATPKPWRTVRMDCGDYWGVEIVGPNGEQVTGETRITAEDRDVVEFYRTAAPIIAAEVQRLHAEVSQWIRAAGENEAMYVAQCSELRKMSAALEEARLTLAAERGEQAGAPSERWRWSQRLDAWVLPFLPEHLPEAYRRPWQDTDEDHDPAVKVYRVFNGQWVARWFRGRPYAYYPTAREALLDVQIRADRHE